jgi:hypothetical protein
MRRDEHREPTRLPPRRDQICDQDAPEPFGLCKTHETIAGLAMALTCDGMGTVSRCGTTQSQLITQRLRVDIVSNA